MSWFCPHAKFPSHWNFPSDFLVIIVDTNVISEFMTSPPAAPVLAWLNAQNARSLYMTTISIAEISYGLQMLPDGKRRRLLQQRFEQFLTLAFGTRILAFDAKSARLYGRIRAHRKAVGRPLSAFDGQIAAIAHAHDYAVATRNVKDFQDCGIELINPFTYEL